MAKLEAEAQRLIQNDDCPYLLRIYDGNPHPSAPAVAGTGPQAGSAVLVAFKPGWDCGYALTAWHNIDGDFSQARAGAWCAQRTPLPAHILAMHRGARLKAGSSGPPTGEPLELMGEWSNPEQDFAVLRLEKAAIEKLGLKPARVSLHVQAGSFVIVRGFERPWDGQNLSGFQGRVALEANVFVQHEIEDLPGVMQDLFRIDLSHPFGQGTSGGGVFHHGLGALIGIVDKVDRPDVERRKRPKRHHTLGFAIPLRVVAETWRDMHAYCGAFVEPRGGVPADTLDADPRSYLEKVRDENLFLDTSAIPTEIPAALELNRVYTPLMAIGTPREPRGGPGHGGRQEPAAHAEELKDVLGAYAHVVLVGHPGTGKTTFVRFITQNLASAWLGDPEALGRLGLAGAPLFPVHVKLRKLADFVDKDRTADLGDDAPEHFYRYLDLLVRDYLELGPDHQPGQLAPGYLRARVLAGNCYLLLDGLDEVRDGALRCW